MTKRFIALLPLMFIGTTNAVQISLDHFKTGLDPIAGKYAIGTNNFIGQRPNITGYLSSWLEAYGGAQSPDVLETGLDYPDVTTNGGSISYTGGGNGRCGRLLLSPYTDASTGTLYIGLLMQLESTGDLYRAFELHDGGFDDGGNRKLQIATGEGVGGLVPGTDFALRVNETTGVTLGAQDTEVNLFIIRIDFSDVPGGDSISVYRNPTDLDVESNNAPTATLTGLDFEFDRVSFARFNGTSGFAFDELRIGTTFTDITRTVDPDADGDGMDDGWEFINMVDDPDDDPDMDGFTNREEFNITTNPNLADTDGDGIDDKAEFEGTGNTFNGIPTDPLVADSDGDGLNDGDEVSNANGFITNPLRADTEGDGENDRAEIAQGSDPLDPASNSLSLDRIFVDGYRDLLYGQAITLQTIASGFGDNQSELDAGYATIKQGKLYILLTGNLQDNFNKLEILIDSTPAGSSTFTSAGNDNAGNMDNLVFDDAFTPEYHLIARRGENKFDLDFADLASTQFASYIDLFPTGDVGSAVTGAPTTSTFAGQLPGIGVAFDNSNTGGVFGDSGDAANQGAAANVETGIELCIDLSILGAPSDDLRICAFINSSDHSSASNQFLGGLPVGNDNLGSPGGINLSLLDGDQFFTVPFPAIDSKITSINYDRATGAGSITFTSILGRNYRIESSTDLQSDWIEIRDDFPASNGATSTWEFTEIGPLPMRKFYRVELAP